MSIARTIRTSEGWLPPMMLLAVLGMVGFGGGFVRGWFFAWHCFMHGRLLGDCVRHCSDIRTYRLVSHVLRFRLRGYIRARLWFELARSACILGTMLAFALFLLAILGQSNSGFSVLSPMIVGCICASL